MGQIISLPLRRKARWGLFGHPKNQTASAGFQPANSSTRGQHAKHDHRSRFIKHLKEVHISFPVQITLNMLRGTDKYLNCVITEKKIDIRRMLFLATVFLL